MKNKINEECLEIFRKKLIVNNKLNSLLKQKCYEYQLIDLKNEEGEILKELNIYVVKLMTYLWEQPKLVANLLSNADKNDLKDNLAPLISNNFFENILSQNYIEDNLLYVLTLLLQKEINNMSNINEHINFLNDTPCYFLLEGLKEKKDIQVFFKMIINKAVEKLESSCSNKDLHFSIGKIEEDIKKKENRGKIKEDNNKSFFKKMTSKKSDIIRNSIDPRDHSISLENDFDLDMTRSTLFEPKVFKEKYFCNFTKEKIIEEKEKFKKENKNKNENDEIDIMFDIYLNKFENGESKNKESVVDHYMNLKNIKYDNEDFLNELDQDEKIKKKYMDNFYRVIETINIIFSSMKDNLYLLPYSIKCLCKIIFILIKKKFPNINILEQNNFIGKLFFGKLFMPYFLYPAYEALITNFLISKKTTNNLEVINDILQKLVSGDLFTNDFGTNEFTPFNLFFLEKMPEVIKLFEETKTVNLPNFIEKLLNNK